MKRLLTEEQTRALYEEHLAGASLREIGAKHGYGHMVISKAFERLGLPLQKRKKGDPRKVGHPNCKVYLRPEQVTALEILAGTQGYERSTKYSRGSIASDFARKIIDDYIASELPIEELQGSS